MDLHKIINKNEKETALLRQSLSIVLSFRRFIQDTSSTLCCVRYDASDEWLFL